MRIKAVFRKIADHKTALTRLIALFSVLLALRLFSEIYESLRFGDLIADLSKHPELLLVAFLVVSLASLARAERLHWLVQSEQIGAMRKYCYVSFFYGMLLSFTPARSAELLRFISPHQPPGFTAKKVVRIFLVEKLVDIVGILILALYLFRADLLGQTWLLLQAVVLALLFFRYRQYVLPYCLSLIAWSLEGAGLYLWFTTLTSFNTLSVTETVAAFASSSLIGALSFVPAGLLVSEMAFISLLEFDNAEIVFAILVLFRLAVLVMNFAFGLISGAMR